MATKAKLWANKVRQAEPTETVENRAGSIYAVLFNAYEGKAFRGDKLAGAFFNDMTLVYNSLIRAGVPTSNISALEGDGQTHHRFVKHPAKLRSLDRVVDSIRQKATADDMLLVFVTNHGNLVNGRCNVNAYRGHIWEEDFQKVMTDLPVNLGVFYFAQCFSGGFAERMGYGRNIGISESGRNEPGIANYDGIPFTQNLFPRLLNPKTTISDAFDHAAQRTFFEVNIGRHDEIPTPQLRWQNANPSRLYLIEDIPREIPAIRELAPLPRYTHSGPPINFGISPEMAMIQQSDDMVLKMCGITGITTLAGAAIGKLCDLDYSTGAWVGLAAGIGLSGIYAMAKEAMIRFRIAKGTYR